MDLTKWKPTTEWAIRMIEEDDNSHNDGALYMETGPCKPWSIPVILALRRRGYRVEQVARGVYYAYPKHN